MKHLFKVALCAAVAVVPIQARAQSAPDALVSIYKAAPGQQGELLKWLMEQDRVAEAAGVPRMQLYAHANGADWDFLVIEPVGTPEQNAKYAAAMKRLGVPQSRQTATEMHKHVISHEDTFVWGPTSPAKFMESLRSN
jgi:hypothetical protein